ncbi:AMMECR1 [Sulfurimonas denitrificans DSM 1251]|uniref:AMMECR1 n=1 Tax=Sulfurimonas denitrificans (strain ATCC 33889 / DSM 1251) TaxID=326298 RepID=Q30PF7_SULDN|nr:AmmeMemoRadiSam system protein A [Sulfurimonas denitrificans]ABB45124.1 AMMECR1 [Sulfurimonas denitrificans DSM 1251]MDD3442809.1 AmmeMemoRadiSam system protein A [Sulfurimonas denitrificans]
MIEGIVLRVAKSAILSRFDSSYSFDKKALEDEYPFLKESGASFVTLKHNGKLRGCIGSIIAHRTLLEDIINNAISSAFKDPRFKALSKEELTNLNLEVSILTPPEILEYEDYEDLLKKVTPLKDGLILNYGSYQGTFLPQVWDELKTQELFLEHLSYKAGANPSIYAYHPTIYRYRVEAIEENFDEVLSL